MNEFRKNIISIYGKQGKQWLDDLPSLIAQVSETYGLSNLKPVQNLSHNYVLTGFQGSKSIILKLGLDIAGFKREAAALMAFSGFGAVHLLIENNGLLLEMRALPGESLKSYFPENDDEAINITAKFIKRLHQAPIPRPHAFPHLKDPGYAGAFAEASWLKALDGDIKIPAQTLQKARKIRDQLLKTAEPDVLLHGDLHHDNILQNGDDWAVIDPKGVIGEPAYEVAAFIRNPMPELLTHKNAQKIIHNRITRFAEILELSEGRILDWCFVQAVLSWAWAIEDGCDRDYFEGITYIFNNLGTSFNY